MEKYNKNKLLKMSYTSTSLSISEHLGHVWSLTLPHMWGSHMYICIKFGYFLLPYVYCIIRPAKETLRIE